MIPTESRPALASGTALDQIRRAGAWLATSLSIGAAGIHLAAGMAVGAVAAGHGHDGDLAGSHGAASHGHGTSAAP